MIDIRELTDQNHIQIHNTIIIVIVHRNEGQGEKSRFTNWFTVVLLNDEPNQHLEASVARRSRSGDAARTLRAVGGCPSLRCALQYCM